MEIREAFDQQDFNIRIKDFVGKSKSNGLYVLPTIFKDDEVTMLIFSYLWTGKQAVRSIREINRKAKETIDNKKLFKERYSSYFVR